MGNLAYLVLGTVFGIVLYKGEIISWFRIQEMFRFQGFHMYGVIFSAVIVGGLSLLLVKKTGLKSLGGDPIAISKKPFTKGVIWGGLIFGMGWAMTGACPGPLYAHLGAGTSVMVVTVVMALMGAWMYGLLKPRLPH